MFNEFKKGFEKGAAKGVAVSLKTPSFGKSLRGSAFAMPSEHVKVDTPKFNLPKGNAATGYQSGATKGIETTVY